MKRLPWILLALVSVIAVLLARQDRRTAYTFDCVREVKNSFTHQSRMAWGAFKRHKEGPELVSCFGGLMLSEDNEKACRATLPGMGGEPYFYCAQFQ